MSTTSALHFKNTHPEQLFEQIKGYKFASTHTYDSSLVTTDEKLFLTSTYNLLALTSRYKRFSLYYRKRGEYMVVRVSATNNIMSQQLVSFINKFSPKVFTIKSLNLNHQVLLYTLSMLYVLDISVKMKPYGNLFAMYIYLPAARQLEVFDR